MIYKCAIINTALARLLQPKCYRHFTSIFRNHSLTKNNTVCHETVENTDTTDLEPTEFVETDIVIHASHWQRLNITHTTRVKKLIKK